jgi:hypothetical protein
LGGITNLNQYYNSSNCPAGTPDWTTTGEPTYLRILNSGVGLPWIMQLHNGVGDIFWSKELGSFSCIAPLTVDTGNGVVSIVPLP